MFYIAFRMLVGDRGKYLGIILGISFASLIMTQQPSVFLGLMARTYSYISDISLPDIWVMDPEVQYVDDSKPLISTELYRVGSVEGVEWAKPLFKGTIQARLPNGKTQTCNLIGLDDATLIGGPGKMNSGKLENLRRSNGIVVNVEGANDKLASPSFIPGRPKTPLKVGDTLELNDNFAKVVGIAETSFTFQSQPLIYTTYSRATGFIPPQRNVLSFILVKAKAGENIQEVATRIKEKTKLAAYTKEQFISKTLNYYLRYTGIPINFGTSVLLGFLVGAAIAGQTFYTFTIENLRHFGVLKAMGTTSQTLLLMIILQAIIVGVIGYGLGLCGTFIFYWLSKGTVLAFKFPWQLMVLSILGVSLICIFAALLSIRRVIKLDAAIVFKS